MKEQMHPLLYEAMKVSGYIKDDGKPKLKEFSEYIGVAAKTVAGWKLGVSGIGEFALKILIEKEQLKKELEKSRAFRKGLRDYLEEDNQEDK